MTIFSLGHFTIVVFSLAILSINKMSNAQASRSALYKKGLWGEKMCLNNFGCVEFAIDLIPEPRQITNPGGKFSSFAYRRNKLIKLLHETNKPAIFIINSDGKWLKVTKDEFFSCGIYDVFNANWLRRQKVSFSPQTEFSDAIPKYLLEAGGAQLGAKSRHELERNLGKSVLLDLYVQPNSVDDAIRDEICMKDLGCFAITEEFYDLVHRPINFLPEEKQQINTQFHLYTNNNARHRFSLLANSVDTLINSPLNPLDPTVFIVHGFLDRESIGKWMQVMKNEFLEKGNYNVIIVDWSGGNLFPYVQATANTRVVGAEIAFLVSQLKKWLKIKPEQCHIIGHSLGSQIAGYAGERIENLGRITALDPAKPYFEHMPPSVRIDPTDANFVDVIHTDSFRIFDPGYGMSQLVGHLDFFPNGGMRQPGCEVEDRLSLFEIRGLIEGGRTLFACNHLRSIQLFISSINIRGCRFVGFPCPNWIDFLQGNCTDCESGGQNCAVMGLSADKYKPDFPETNIQLFLETTQKEPFCMHHYQVIIQFQDDKTHLKVEEIKLTIRDKLGQITVIIYKNRNDGFSPQGKLTYLITNEVELTPEETIDFYWKSSNYTSYDVKQVVIEYIKIVPMNFMKQRERQRYTIIYYPINEDPIKEMETFRMKLKKAI